MAENKHVFPFIQEYLPSGIRDRLQQESLTIDMRAPPWPPAPRGLPRPLGPPGPSGAALWGQRPGTALRGTALPGGTFPQGEITPVGITKKQRLEFQSHPRPAENPGAGGHWRKTSLRKAQGIICSAALHKGPCSPHTHVLLSVFPMLKPSYSPAAV